MKTVLSIIAVKLKISKKNRDISFLVFTAELTYHQKAMALNNRNHLFPGVGVLIRFIWCLMGCQDD